MKGSRENPGQLFRTCVLCGLCALGMLAAVSDAHGQAPGKAARIGAAPKAPAPPKTALLA